MQLSAEHYAETDAAIADIREIETRGGVTREALSAIQARLTRLAARKDLFNLERLPAPPPGENTNNYLYRLHEDPDHRYALYANASRAKVVSPAHYHTTWAVICGVTGEELNRIYERTADGGVREVRQKVVRDGDGIAFLPDDIHSIQIDAPLLHFHLYGLALEQLVRREYYDPQQRTWVVYTQPLRHIREARRGTPMPV